MGGARIPEKNAEAAEGGDDEGRRDPGQHQPAGIGGVGKGGDTDDDRGGQQGTGEGEDRHGDEPEEHAGVQQHDDGTKGGTGGDAEQMRVGQLVAGNGLQGRAHQGKAGTDNGTQHHPRQPHFPHDVVAAGGPGDLDTAWPQVSGHHFPDLVEGNGNRAHADSGRHRSSEHEQQGQVQQRQVVEDRVARSGDTMFVGHFGWAGSEARPRDQEGKKAAARRLIASMLRGPGVASVYSSTTKRSFTTAGMSLKAGVSFMKAIFCSAVTSP